MRVCVWRLGLVVGIAGALGLSGCSGKPKAPPREDLAAQLAEVCRGLLDSEGAALRFEGGG